MEKKVAPLGPVAAHADSVPADPAADPRVPFAQSEDFLRVLAAAHEHLLNSIEDGQVDIDAWSPVTVARYVTTQTDRFVQEWRIPVNAAEMEIVAAALVKELTGFGPLEDLLRDPAIDAILIKGYRDIHVSQAGQLVPINQRFTDDDHLLRILRRILAPLGRRLDEDCPIADVRLPAGGHLNAIIPPLALDGPVVSIRKFRRTPFTCDELLRMGTFDPAVHALLNAMVLGRCNILVCGTADSGKTSLLNAMAGYIPADERIATVEEVAELTLKHPHVVRLESRAPGVDGQGAVGIRELMRSSLGMRPDRILVGELRGAEVIEMLQAMATGHDGSMATVRASSARDCLQRLEILAGLAGFQGSEDNVRRQIASAVDFVVHVQRLGSGRRVVASISEVTGISDVAIGTRELFHHELQIDADGREQDRWVGIDLQPRSSKLEAFRRQLRQARGSRS